MISDVLRTVADGIAQPEEDVVQRRRGLVPPRLLDAVGLGGLPRPRGLQRCYLRPQVIQRSVEPGRRGVNLLTDGVFDRTEVV